MVNVEARVPSTYKNSAVAPKTFASWGQSPCLLAIRRHCSHRPVGGFEHRWTVRSHWRPTWPWLQPFTAWRLHFCLAKFRGFF